MLAILSAGFLAACTDLPGWTRAECTYTAQNAGVNLPTQFSQNSTFELNGNLAKWDYVGHAQGSADVLFAPAVINVTNNANVVINNGIVQFPMMRVQGSHYARITYNNVSLELVDYRGYDVYQGNDSFFISYYTAGINHDFYNVNILNTESYFYSENLYKMTLPSVFAGYNNMTYNLRNVHLGSCLVDINDYVGAGGGQTTDNLYYIINDTKRESTDFFSMTSSSIYTILQAWGPVNLQPNAVYPYNIEDLGGNVGPDLRTFTFLYQTGLVQSVKQKCPACSETCFDYDVCAEAKACAAPNTCPDNDCCLALRPKPPQLNNVIIRGQCKECTGVLVFSVVTIKFNNYGYQTKNTFIPQCITPFEDVPCDAPPASAVTDLHAHDFGVHAHASEKPHEHPTSRGTPRSTWAALGLGASALLAV